MSLRKASLFLLSVVCLFAEQTFFYAESNLQATVTAAQGSIRFREPSSTDWQEIRPGQKINEKTEIMTGPKSQCVLALGNGQAAAKIEADSFVVLESIDPVSIRMQSGKIYALARNLKKGSSFQVKTLAAIASTRGTGWVQSPNNIQVFEHTVHVENFNGQSTDVPEGKEADILDDGTLGDLKDVSEEAKDDWQSFEDENGEQGNGETSGDNENSPLNALERQDENISDLKEDINESKDEDKINEDLKPDPIPDSGGEY